MCKGVEGGARGCKGEQGWMDDVDGVFGAGHHRSPSLKNEN